VDSLHPSYFFLVTAVAVASANSATDDPEFFCAEKCGTLPSFINIPPSTPLRFTPNQFTEENTDTSRIPCQQISDLQDIVGYIHDTYFQTLQLQP